MTVFFFFSNVYLVLAPYVPPTTPAENVYKTLPYYLHCVVALGVFAIGAIYYVVWAILLPRFGGYLLVKETVVDADGWSRSVFTRMALSDSRHRDDAGIFTSGSGKARSSTSGEDDRGSAAIATAAVTAEA